MAVRGWWRGCRKVPYRESSPAGTAIGSAVARGVIGLPSANCIYATQGFTTLADSIATDFSMTFNGATLSTTAAATVVASYNLSVHSAWTDHMVATETHLNLLSDVGMTYAYSITTSALAYNATEVVSFLGCSTDGSSGSTVHVAVEGTNNSACDVELRVGGTLVDSRSFTTSGLHEYDVTVGDLGIWPTITDITLTVKNKNPSASQAFFCLVSGDYAASATSHGNRAGPPPSTNYPIIKTITLNAHDWDASDVAGAMYRSGSVSISGGAWRRVGWRSTTIASFSDPAAIARITTIPLTSSKDVAGPTHYFDVEELCTKWTS